MLQSARFAVDPSPPSAEPYDPARRPLIALSVCAFVATVTGTFVYAYPESFAAIRREMIVVHDVSGDLTLLAGALYLRHHLVRTWRMWRRVLSRFTGYLAVLVLAVAGGTGIYGQFYDMPSDSWPGMLHIGFAIASLVLACFHGGYGLRHRFRSPETRR